MNDNKHVEIFVQFDWKYWGSSVYMKDPQNLSQIAEAIGIPEGISVKMEIDEF